MTANAHAQQRELERLKRSRFRRRLIMLAVAIVLVLLLLAAIFGIGQFSCTPGQGPGAGNGNEEGNENGRNQDNTEEVSVDDENRPTDQDEPLPHFIFRFDTEQEDGRRDWSGTITTPDRKEVRVEPFEPRPRDWNEFMTKLRRALTNSRDDNFPDIERVLLVEPVDEEGRQLLTERQRERIVDSIARDNFEVEWTSSIGNWD